MAQTTINVRMDTELKKEIEKIFEQMGMNTTTAFNIFARAVVQTRKIPFEIYAPKVNDMDKFFNEMKLPKKVAEEMAQYEVYDDYVNALINESEREEEVEPNGGRDFEEVIEEIRGQIDAAKNKV